MFRFFEIDINLEPCIYDPLMLLQRSRYLSSAKQQSCNAVVNLVLW